MDVSIVVLNYNTRAHLRACLGALRGDGLECEVLVVDNASSDGSADMVETEFHWVRLIRSPRNGGQAFRQNQGFRPARGEAVLILNPDTLLPAGVLAALVEKLHEHPEAGIVGPKLLRP